MAEVKDYFIERAIAEIAKTYRQEVSIIKKDKSLDKFGTNEAVGSSSQHTVMDLYNDESEETFVYSNLIDSLSTTDAGNLFETSIEGHYLNSNINIISITRSGNTATITTETAHGLLGYGHDGVLIVGSDQSEYNGRFRVLSTPSSTTFTIYVFGTPTSPATGTMYITPLIWNFHEQKVYTNGTSKISLSQPLATATRAVNMGATKMVGSLYVFDDTDVVLTGGAPNVEADSQVHLIMKAGDDQSRKASTTISNTDYWIINHIEASINKKTTATVDVRIQIMTSYGVWRTVFPLITLSTSGQNVFDRDLKKPIIVPRNSHFRFSAISSTINTQVSAGASGVLATVMNNL